MAGPEISVFLDRKTCQIVELSDEDIEAADDEDAAAAAPEWQRGQIELAREVEADTDDRFLPLPDKFDVNEWETMAEFASSIPNETSGSLLQSAIRGAGAFRRFKDTIHILGIAEQWYVFRDNRHRELAMQWCRDHEVEWDDPPRPTA
jgi:hypothetical protein